MRYPILLVLLCLSLFTNGREEHSNMDFNEDPPVPVYNKVKELYIPTSLAVKGISKAIIVAPRHYWTEATAVQKAIKAISGVAVTIKASAGITGIPGENLILIGNRSDNPVINNLYDKGYSFLDLKYPGREGYVVRSLHNPLGNGKNILFIGASDPVGMKEAAQVFIKKLREQTRGQQDAVMGYLSEIRLGKDYQLPERIEEAEIWEASEMYRSTGYFGWNIISKSMALFYMTNDEKYLEAFLRLAFPNAAAMSEIDRLDGERIENKTDPLAGPYHYSAHMMIVLWDLIEESPLLTDDQRLKVTNAFARQLPHRVVEGIYHSTKMADYVGNRHGDWSALSLFVLGRYFHKDYPEAAWKKCIDAADLYFSGLDSSYWMAGNNDHLFWFSSFYDPVLDYLLLSGKRHPNLLTNLRKGLNTQQIIYTGQKPDWGLKAASISMLNKAAYLLNDGRWIYYRQQTLNDTNTFRLGQSYWPDAKVLRSSLPADITGLWNVQQMPEKMWQYRKIDFPRHEAFRWGSYRSQLGPGGDYILLKGYNGAGRNPYHAFSILELRLDSATLLKGFHNQVFASVDGLVAPQVAMNASLQYAGCVGEAATAVVTVPGISYSNWTRTLVQLKHKYIVVSDCLTYEKSTDNMRVQTTWQMPGASWNTGSAAIECKPAERAQTIFTLKGSEPAQVQQQDGVITMNYYEKVEAGDTKKVFYLLKEGTNFQCINIAPNVAMWSAPGKILAIAGDYRQFSGALITLDDDHLYGYRLISAGWQRPVFKASAPVNIDWNLKNGTAVVECDTAVTVELSAITSTLYINGKKIQPASANGRYLIRLIPGTHKMQGLAGNISLDEAGNALSAGKNEQQERQQEEVQSVPSIEKVYQTKISGQPAATCVITGTGGKLIAVSSKNNVELLNTAGSIVRHLQLEGNIRVMHWWKEAQLLLVGCADEKVVAFDTAGNKKWAFTSVMDKAVYEAGKQYWFKSAYPGVDGLFSGVFDNGQSRAFVGSACTIEILDEKGGLVKRVPVFWGNPVSFLVTDAADGSKNLLAARWPSDLPNLAIVNSKKMETTGYGYVKVPDGHTFVDGWMAMSRYDNFKKDMDGDGKDEIISAINGSWNRIAIYNEAGAPLYHAQIGPGAVAPRSTIRMMDVGNVNQDNKLEIVAALSSGYLVVLDHRLEVIWSRKFPVPPSLVKIIPTADNKALRLLVAFENGEVLLLDEAGKSIKQSHYGMRFHSLDMLQDMAVLTAVTGEVLALKIK